MLSAGSDQPHTEGVGSLTLIRGSIRASVEVAATSRASSSLARRRADTATGTDPQPPALIHRYQSKDTHMAIDAPRRSATPMAGAAGQGRTST